MVAPIAMPATERPFMAEMITMRPTVPNARPPLIGPIQTWIALYMSSAMPDSESM